MSDLVQTEVDQQKHGSNHAQQAIARLRATAESEQESPVERLKAAASLLTHFGPTKRNYAVIQRTIKLFINSRDNDIAERAKKVKKKLLKAVELNEVVSTELPEELETEACQAPVVETSVTKVTTEEPNSETKTPAAFAPLPIVPRLSYPPDDLIFPPPPEIYRLGSIDFDVVVERLRKANALNQFPPDVGKDRDNEEFLRIALGLSPTQPVTLEVVQQLAYARQYEPRKDNEYLSRGERNEYTSLMSFLHAAMFYYSHSTFGYNALKRAPRKPDAPRSFMDDMEERAA